MIKDRHYRDLGATQFGNELCSAICKAVLNYAPKNRGFDEMKFTED